MRLYVPVSVPVPMPDRDAPIRKYLVTSVPSPKLLVGMLPIPLVNVPSEEVLDAVLREAVIVLLASPERARDERDGTVKVIAWVLGAFCARKDASPQDGVPLNVVTPLPVVTAADAAVGSIAAVPPPEEGALRSVPKLTVDEVIERVQLAGGDSMTADTVTVWAFPVCHSRTDRERMDRIFFIGLRLVGS